MSQNTFYLRFVSSHTLGPTKGDGNLAQAGGVFTGHLDPDFKSWGTNKFGVDTPEQSVNIYELWRDATFATLFGSLGVSIPSLCWQQAQIKEFAHSHGDWLHQTGGTNLFLFEVDGQVFVACVTVCAGKLLAIVRRFSFEHVWFATFRHRVIVPQLIV